MKKLIKKKLIKQKKTHFLKSQKSYFSFYKMKKKKIFFNYNFFSCKQKLFAFITNNNILQSIHYKNEKKKQKIKSVFWDIVCSVYTNNSINKKKQLNINISTLLNSKIYFKWEQKELINKLKILSSWRNSYFINFFHSNYINRSKIIKNINNSNKVKNTSNSNFQKQNTNELTKKKVSILSKKIKKRYAFNYKTKIFHYDRLKINYKSELISLMTVNPEIKQKPYIKKLISFITPKFIIKNIVKKNKYNSFLHREYRNRIKSKVKKPFKAIKKKYYKKMKYFMKFKKENAYTVIYNRILVKLSNYF